MSIPASCYKPLAEHHETRKQFPFRRSRNLPLHAAAQIFLIGSLFAQKWNWSDKIYPSTPGIPGGVTAVAADDSSQLPGFYAVTESSGLYFKKAEETEWTHVQVQEGNTSIFDIQIEGNTLIVALWPYPDSRASKIWESIDAGNTWTPATYDPNIESGPYYDPITVLGVGDGILGLGSFSDDVIARPALVGADSYYRPAKDLNYRTPAGNPGSITDIAFNKASNTWWMVSDYGYGSNSINESKIMRSGLGPDFNLERVFGAEDIGDTDFYWSSIAVSDDGQTVVAGGSDGILCSRDGGSTWNRSPSLVDPIVVVRYLNGLFLAGSSTEHVWSSADGIAWVLRGDWNDVSNFTGFGIRDIAYSNGEYVVVGKYNVNDAWFATTKAETPVPEKRPIISIKGSKKIKTASRLVTIKGTARSPNLFDVISIKASARKAKITRLHLDGKYWRVVVRMNANQRKEIVKIQVTDSAGKTSVTKRVEIIRGSE